MLNHLSQNWTLAFRKEVSWRPSRIAIQTALSTLGLGTVATLCSVPAIAASLGKTSAHEAPLSDFLFLGFLGGIALAPLVSLCATSAWRMVMEKRNFKTIPELDIEFSPAALAAMSDQPFARSIQLPNTRFGEGRVEFHRLPKSLEVELCTGTLG